MQMLHWMGQVTQAVLAWEPAGTEVPGGSTGMVLLAFGTEWETLVASMASKAMIGHRAAAMGWWCSARTGHRARAIPAVLADGGNRQAMAAVTWWRTATEHGLAAVTVQWAWATGWQSLAGTGHGAWVTGQVA